MSARKSLRFLLGFLLALPTLWVAQRSARAAPLDPKSQDWEGLTQLVELARAELGARRTVVTSHLNLWQLRKEDSLFIIHPEGALDVDDLSAFMRAGGRIALLDDYGSGDELLASFGIRRVPLPLKPAEMLRDNPALAIAEPASTYAAVRDVGRVVTNHATGLERRSLASVLTVRGDGEPDVQVAIAGNVGQGHLLAVGDSSILMNSMLRYPGNHALARTLVRLAGEGDGKLYVLANDFVMTGTFGADTRFDTVLGQAWQTLAGALETLRHDGMPSLVAYLLALVLGLSVVAWTSVRAGRPHRSVVPRFVKPAPPAVQGGIAGRAAVLGAPGTSRVLAMLELKSALEEDLAARLGLDRAPSAEELARRARAAGLLDAEAAESLVRVLKWLSGFERGLSPRRPGAVARVRDRDVRTVAARVRALLEAVGDAHP